MQAQTRYRPGGAGPCGLRKTTLSEAMLYRAGVIRKLGQVDQRDAFGYGRLGAGTRHHHFFKTGFAGRRADPYHPAGHPGHVDFSAEAERTLQVLDYAVLVISGPGGVQSHTETLWQLLRRYHIPTFVFINKINYATAQTRAELLEQLNRRLGEGFVVGADSAPGRSAGSV